MQHPFSLPGFFSAVIIFTSARAIAKKEGKIVKKRDSAKINFNIRKMMVLLK